MKPNVRLKAGSAKNAHLTSQSAKRAADAVNKAKQQRQSRFQSGRRTRSLDRTPAITAGPSSSSNSGYQTRSKVTATGSPIVSRNQFEVLSDDDSGDGVQVELEKKQPRVRVPPIHIVGLAVGDVVTLLSANGVPQSDEYLLKYTPSSVQFLTKSKEVFTKTVALLKSRDVQFFTHDTSDNIPSKFVLSGLPVIDIPDLKEELEAVGIVPMDIKVLSSAKSGADEHALYLVYFKRGSMKIQDLRKIRAICNVVVSWRYFTKRANDAAQCHRCQRFGHGSAKCNLPPQCVKCGKKHLTDVCLLPRKSELDGSNQDKSQLKCANCGGSHTANFRGCPARKAYLDELEKRKKKKPIRPTVSTTGASIPGNSGATSGPSRPIVVGQRSYAQVASRNEPAIPSNNSSDDGLFTVTQFMSLARDMFSRMVQCRTKQQQFEALAELLAKYLYNG